MASIIHMGKMSKITDVHLTVTSQKFSGVLGHGKSGHDLTNYYIAHKFLRHTALCMKLGENVLCTTLNILND